MDLLERTKLLLNELVNFKLAYDVSCYLSDRARTDWRSFEMEQHEEYPIKGCGLIASREHVANWTPRKETILHLEEDLAPEETGAEIDSFPRDTVATTYVFSLLEGYGNDVCDFLNPGYRKQHQAWHHGVYGDADLQSQSVREKMERNFRKPFLANNQVPINIVSALVELKKTRNKIIHQLEHTRDFELFFRATVAIACCIYTMCDESAGVIKVYPWEDYHGKYMS